jgi:hypothetical protein
MAAGIVAPPDPQDSIENPPTLPPIEGAPPQATASPSAPATPGAGAPGSTPAKTQMQQDGVFNPPAQKGQIPTGPQAEFDPKKLAKVKTTLDLLNAMKPQSRSDYMDWWQKQHGDINDRYDSLKAQIGARPSDDEPQTRKEKFAALLEFGLHLMKNSAAPSQNQGAVLESTLSDSVEDAQKQHQANIQGKQQAYDAQAQAIESAREKDLEGIGTPAAAMKTQADLSRQDTENLKDRAAAYKDVSQTLDEQERAQGPKTYSTGKDGNLYSLEPDENGNPRAKPVLGIDGKPFNGRVLGRDTGSGIDKDDTAQIRNLKFLTGVLGVDPDRAANIAFKPKTNDPMKDHADVYKSIMTATMGDTDKAKTGADQYIIDNYGAGALSRATAPVVPPQKPQGGPIGVPPPQALQGLKPGMVRDFGPKGKWTVGIDGTPKLVGASAPLQ